MRTIAENLRDVQDRIAQAANRAGRDPLEIRLVGVTKTQPAEVVREALAAGLREIGENYIQEAEAKFAALGPTPGTGRHLIGHLQKNKAGKALALFDCVQSVDSLELAQALGRRAEAGGRVLDILIEVNVSGEVTKFGVMPEHTLDLVGEISAIKGIRLMGLMGMGPLTSGPNGEHATRNCFQQLAKLFERLPSEHRQILSMGMTGDFELAIAEGSNMVRVGTGIFGARRSS